MIASNAAEFGGGLYLGPNTTALIKGDSVIEVNTARSGGGGIADLACQESVGLRRGVPGRSEGQHEHRQDQP